ncbi:hypothetical protein COV06_04495 [Candidatus Uhrbacteria bacterium CG10_big_fil_rev_8_21_14_0_10_50_16]|uniref:Uncharacterized protein n=1 Tax=Candidatus Uhrbacteria bacterium CG10_big_fil_rev_8_21_14_0_10_50_16 TaxID=1975039 RepID=A0A2H0RL89_9BACT|nr:MAG: hypothetical protein COV06_04495 [Candidatus Uhrbacteria bacterium CG10_big_fil_rev_8_21_14_0_10_50_16]
MSLLEQIHRAPYGPTTISAYVHNFYTFTPAGVEQQLIQRQSHGLDSAAEAVRTALVAFFGEAAGRRFFQHKKEHLPPWAIQKMVAVLYLEEMRWELERGTAPQEAAVMVHNSAASAGWDLPQIGWWAYIHVMRMRRPLRLSRT